MHKIKEKLMEELYEVENNLKKAGDGKMSAGDLEYIHKLTDTIKNIDKIEILEEETGYSEDGGNWMARGTYGGNSYEGGNSYARRKRDSMGRYSRDGGGYSEDGGSSYARSGQIGNRGGSRGGYSREGYSRGDAKEHMINKMEEMMEMASTDKEREAIRQCISKIENA